MKDEKEEQNLENNLNDKYFRLTLRIPVWLLRKIELKRKQRTGRISRNLFIIEAIDNIFKE